MIFYEYAGFYGSYSNADFLDFLNSKIEAIRRKVFLQHIW